VGQKPQIVVFNKMDLPQAQERWPEVQAALKERGVAVMAISAATQQDTRKLVQRMFHEYAQLPQDSGPTTVIETPVYELKEDDLSFDIEREVDGSFRVSGRRIERAAAMTYWDYEEAVMRFQDILETLGITKALEKAGVQVGDTVHIGEFELQWSD
jgi:GTP-binding protein